MKTVKPSPKLKDTTKYLKCALNPTELLARAKSLAHANGEIKSVTAQLAEAKANLPKKIAELEAEQGRLAQIVANEAELRDVPCLQRWTEDDRIEVVRLDSMEVVELRAPTTDERQLKLELEKEVARAAEAAEPPTQADAAKALADASVPTPPEPPPAAAADVE